MAGRDEMPGGGARLGPIVIRTRRGRVVAIAGFLAVVVAAVVLAALLVPGDDQLKPGQRPPDARSVARLYAGIPQAGQALGSPRAPVTMVEYEDLQCPSCRAFAASVVPQLVAQRVRSGRLRLVLRPIAFLGADSRTAALAVLAAGRQNRLFALTALLYAHQGGENSGWVTPAYLRQLGGAVAGLDVGAALRAAAQPRAAQDLAADKAAAAADGVRATPTVLVGRTGGPLRTITGSRLSAGRYLRAAATGSP